MNNQKEAESYKGIFKSTFLFGFVQILNILIKVLLNKVAAIFLGSVGIGTIGIFQSASEIIKTFFGLGVSQSAVRDIAKAKKDGDRKEFLTIIAVTHKVVWVTSLIGALFTIIFSKSLSKLSFGDESYSFAFILLSIVVFFNILADGQLGILKGMRQLRLLAKATIFGSLAGFLCGVPLYYFLGNDGIVPTLLSVTVSLATFSTYYVKKIECKNVSISLKDAYSESSSMLKMGVVLMFVTFAGMVSDYVMKIYILNNSDLSTVGVYQAGLTIVSGYFSIVIVAMMTDYYPRISAVHDDNNKLIEELNRQAKVGLVIITPLIVAFMFLMPFFIEFLYSREFLASEDYMKYAIFWTLIIIVSNPIDMILIAKQNTKVFLIATIIYRLFGLLISIYNFDNYGLQGLGIAMLTMGLFHIILMQSIMYKLYNILVDFKTFKMLINSLCFCFLALYISGISDSLLKYQLGAVLLVISIWYSIKHFNDVTSLNIFDFIKSKLGRKT